MDQEQPGTVYAKVDLWRHERPEREEETRVFAEDGPPIALTFRKPDAADICAAAARMRQLVEDFIEGSEERGAADFHDGIKVSPGLFDTAATAYESQPVPVYSVEEFVLMSDRRPRDWPKIVAWLRGLAADWQVQSGK